MRRPRIGIPLCLDDRGRWRAGREYVYADQGYAAAIDRAGGVALFVSIQSSPEAIVEGLDGLLVPGGDDLPADPLRGEASPAPGVLDLAPERQVEFDTALLRAARAAGLPILGICYGMQLLARAAGGTLLTHLPSQRPELADHKLPDWNARHALEIADQSRLAAIVGTRRLTVNSLHHQGVLDAGPALAVCAQSEDGLIEAIESGPSAPFEIGVQWHPEKMEDEASEQLFRAFVEACHTKAFARETG